MGSRGDHRPVPPHSWILGVVAIPLHLPPWYQKWSQAPTATHQNHTSGCKLLPLPLHTLEAKLSCSSLPRTPRPGSSHHICTPPIKEMTTSTCWGKRQQASLLKTTLALNVLNPHKSHREDPTYKLLSKMTVDNCFSYTPRVREI